MARLDLGGMHLWLYPLEDGTVLVETEDKSAAEMLADDERRAGGGG